MAKVNGYVVGKMKVDCMYMQGLIWIFLVIDRTGGGASHITRYSKETACQKVYTCTATFKFPDKDPSGSQTYWFTNEPTSQGTMVTQGIRGAESFCLPSTPVYLHCTSTTAKF